MMSSPYPGGEMAKAHTPRKGGLGTCRLCGRLYEGKPQKYKEKGVIRMKDVKQHCCNECKELL